MNQNTPPRHPRHRAGNTHDPLTELAYMTRDHQVSTRHGAPDAEQPQYVATAHARDEHTGQVLLAMSPAAAAALAQVLTRFHAIVPNPGVGMEGYCPQMWDQVAFDLVRHRAFAAGTVAETVMVSRWHDNTSPEPRHATSVDRTVDRRRGVPVR